MRKLSGFLYVLLYVVIYFAAVVFASIAVPLIVFIIKIFSGEFGVPEDFLLYFFDLLENNTLVIEVMTVCITMLLFCVILISRRIKIRDVFRTNGMLGFREIGAAALFAYGANVFAVIITSLKVLEPFMGEYSQTVEAVFSGPLWMVFIVVAVLAPVFEELMYRGVIMYELRRSWSFLFANIFQATIFGVMHMNLVQGLYTAVLGLIIGYAYEKSGTVYMAVLIHFLFNASNLFVGGLFENILSPLLYIMSGIAAISAACILLEKRVDKSGTMVI